jgi:hypothetical protein
VQTITVDVWLYGPLARYGGEAARASYANVRLELPSGSQVRDILARLAMPTEERGITFINGDLSAVPEVQPDLDQVLEDDDRVAFFHLRSMWPSQYRHGAGRTPELARALDEGKGAYRHRAS